MDKVVYLNTAAKLET